MRETTAADILDKARERNHLRSDYALSKLTGISEQVLSNWRNGRSLPDEKGCMKIAPLAGLDPHVLIARFNAARAHDPAIREIWHDIARKLVAAAKTAKTAVPGATKSGAGKRSGERPESVVPTFAL